MHWGETGCLWVGVVSACARAWVKGGALLPRYVAKLPADERAALYTWNEPWMTRFVRTAEVHERMIGSGELTMQQLDKARDTVALVEEETHIPREIKRSSITLISKLGSGQFGSVWKGLLDETKSGGVPGNA